MEPSAPLPSAAPQVGPAVRLLTVRFDRWLRGVMIVGGLVLIGMLGVAWSLEPSSRGFGTHQQLGLPPCTSIAMWGMRCPACGMTTSWAYLMRGNLLASLSVNSGGTLLGVAAAIAGPWLLASGLRGRWVGQPPHELVLAGICLTIAAVIVIDWMVRLYWG